MLILCKQNHVQLQVTLCLTVTLKTPVVFCQACESTAACRVYTGVHEVELVSHTTHSPLHMRMLINKLIVSLVTLDKFVSMASLIKVLLCAYMLCTTFYKIKACYMSTFVAALQHSSSILLCFDKQEQHKCIVSSICK